MAQKPPNLLYGVEDKPPIGVTLTLGFQHIFLMVSILVLPVAIVQQINGTQEQVEHVIKMSMIAGGFATILQALRKGPVGSGYLCPQLCGPSYFSASLLAAKTGGLSLLFGMTLVSGAFEALLSRVIYRLRVLFPTEITGLVVTLVGIALVPLGVENFLGTTRAHPGDSPHEGTAAFLTLAIMVGINVWTSGKWRLYSVLIGIGAGYLISYFLGILTAADLHRLREERWISIPELNHAGWSFDWVLLFPFLIASLCAVLKTVGDVTMCQKINDLQWKRPDMSSISKGILASALSTISAGLLGGVGQTTSSSNVGVSIATGAASIHPRRFLPSWNPKAAPGERAKKSFIAPPPP